MLDMFCSTLGNATLQRHLLAMRPNTMMEAVQHGNEYIQVRPDRPQTESKVRHLDEAEIDEEDRVAPTSHDIMASLLKAMEQLTAQVAKLQQGAATKKDDTQKCWGCKKSGHTRKECATHPWPQKPTTQAENGDSPQ